jgi:hypothetical protein
MKQSTRVGTVGVMGLENNNVSDIELVMVNMLKQSDFITFMVNGKSFVITFADARGRARG